MTNKIKTDHGKKFLFLIILVSLAIFVLLAANRFTMLREMLMKRITYRMETVGNLLSAEIIEDYLANRPDDVYNSIDTAAEQPLVEFVSIIDAQGRVVMSSRRQFENMANLFVDTPDLRQAEKNMYIRSFPLKQGTLDRGKVQMAFSLKQLKQDTNIILLWSGLLSGLGFALLLALALAMTAAQKKQLENANQQLLELGRMKSEFVAVASHELRTPLTSIVGFARTMMKIKLSEEKKEQYLKIIESEGLRLAKMAEDTLNISRIETGNLELHYETIDLGGLISNIASTIETNNIEIAMAVPPELKLQADPDRLKQIIVNLLSNALRYSPEGGKVSLTARAAGSNIEISVTDEGPGIPADCLDKIFEKFYRCQNDINQKHRGTGLGLSICEGLVKLHGGRIRVKSAPGQGSTFTFSIPKEQGGK